MNRAGEWGAFTAHAGRNFLLRTWNTRRYQDSAVVFLAFENWRSKKMNRTVVNMIGVSVRKDLCQCAA
jgi:hypothetical protein